MATVGIYGESLDIFSQNILLPFWEFSNILDLYDFSLNAYWFTHFGEYSLPFWFLNIVLSVCLSVSLSLSLCLCLSLLRLPGSKYLSLLNHLPTLQCYLKSISHWVLYRRLYQETLPLSFSLWNHIQGAAYKKCFWSWCTWLKDKANFWGKHLNASQDNSPSCQMMAWKPCLYAYVPVMLNVRTVQGRVKETWYLVWELRLMSLQEPGGDLDLKAHIMREHSLCTFEGRAGKT